MYDSKEMATALNSYFIDSAKNLTNDSCIQIHAAMPLSTTTPVFNLNEVTQLDADRVDCSLRNSKAKDAFYMDTMFLKTH